MSINWKQAARNNVLVETESGHEAILTRYEECYRNKFYIEEYDIWVNKVRLVRQEDIEKYEYDGICRNAFCDITNGHIQNMKNFIEKGVSSCSGCPFYYNGISCESYTFDGCKVFLNVAAPQFLKIFENYFDDED